MDAEIAAQMKIGPRVCQKIKSPQITQVHARLKKTNFLIALPLRFIIFPPFFRP